MMEEGELCFPQLLNSSCRRLELPHTELMLYYVVLSCLSGLTALLNLLVIISLSHFRQLHTPTNLLLLSLAVSDFLVGLLLFFQILLIDGCWYFGDIVCTQYQYLAYFITSASIGTMVLISVDRYVAICYPLHYSTHVTADRARLCICLCWICSWIFQILILKDNLQQPGRFNSCVGECVFVVNNTATYTDLIFSFILPITVIVVLYVRVFIVAVSQSRAMRLHVGASAVKSSAFAKTSQIKAAKTLGVVVIVFLMCMCPFYCVSLAGQQTAQHFVVSLFYVNSCLNPVFYVFFYPWFRKSIKLIFTLQILNRHSCDINLL
ncbi:trace amine-associated receptor 13c-like [Nothobranchius furzeri]|uniref:trace amine-associated receptor 13c-like n=1 Tax=Nothobranchius furzeri TaxID=105023 RepID=UPI0039048722